MSKLVSKLVSKDGTEAHRAVDVRGRWLVVPGAVPPVPFRLGGPLPTITLTLYERREFCWGREWWMVWLEHGYEEDLIPLVERRANAAYAVGLFAEWAGR